MASGPEQGSTCFRGGGARLEAYFLSVLEDDQKRSTLHLQPDTFITKFPLHHQNFMSTFTQRYNSNNNKIAAPAVTTTTATSTVTTTITATLTLTTTLITASIVTTTQIVITSAVTTITAMSTVTATATVKTTTLTVTKTIIAIPNGGEDSVQ